MNDEADDIMRRSDDLDERLDVKANAVIKDLVLYAEKTRRLTKLVIVIMAVMIIVVVVLAGAVIKVQSNSSHVAKVEDVTQAIADSSRERCEASNKAKAQEKTLWTFILGQPAPPGQTDEQKAALVQFSKIVDEAYKPLDCPKANQP